MIRIFLLIILFSCNVASAQLRLPSINLPVQQTLNGLNLPDVLHSSRQLLREVDIKDTLTLQTERLNAIKKLLAEHPESLEADPRGEINVRNEIIAWSPSIDALSAALGAGFLVKREQNLDALGETIVVLQTPVGMSTTAALAMMQQLDKTGVYDYNHIYLSSGSTAPDHTLNMPAPDNDATRRQSAKTEKSIRVGLIDAGIQIDHRVFANAKIEQHTCNKNMPTAHGTAVASLMIGKYPPFYGVQPDAILYAADIYCGSDTGGALDKLVDALGWLSHEKVAVINLSLVGPPNATLERAVKAMTAKGFLLIAAVGNDGPAAAPLYPASYPGVVGVTGVDALHHALPEAARGPQVMFAAPGSNMLAAALGRRPFQSVRGTSFASPIVATILARKLSLPNPVMAKNAVDDLVRQIDDAKQSNHAELGYGIVGDSYRISPEDFY